MVRADFSAFITATTASHARVPEGWESWLFAMNWGLRLG